ncbi:MAG: hypothetical protein EX254_00690 [Flavobacteriaceae bacterium]|nr:MAG: hypothetical protein EX254_00690 [Flavobacteriaceae bacterium]
MLQQAIHYGIHFLLPLLIAVLFFRPIWKKAYLIMILAMIIDLDHLLADPIFDPNRCSIGFHPLHSYYSMAIYFILLIPKITRVFAIGLLIHLLADGIDCWSMQL